MKLELVQASPLVGEKIKLFPQFKLHPFIGYRVYTSWKNTPNLYVKAPEASSLRALMCNLTKGGGKPSLSRGRRDSRPATATWSLVSGQW
jgi:hypothetical protein